MENTAIMAQTVGALRTAFSADLFSRFIEYTDVKDLTLKGYSTGLRAFAEWLRGCGITQPTRDNIKEYKQHLSTAGYTAGTQASYLRIVKHFFKWTASEGLFPNIADNIKGAKVGQDNTKRDAFAREDVQTILQSIDRSSEVGKRDYAIILLCVSCALRIIEMHRADIGDLQTIRGQRVLYIQGKGHDEKDAYIKIVPEVDAALSDYFSARTDTHKGAPLFVGTSNRAKGARLSEPSLSTIIKDRFKAAGYDYDKLTAHSLRHTGVTALLKANGGNIQQAQRYARHKNLNTTLIYSHNIEREKDKSESMVYQYLFSDSGTQTAKAQAVAMVQELTEEQAAQVLEYMRLLRG